MNISPNISGLAPRAGGPPRPAESAAVVPFLPTEMRFARRYNGLDEDYAVCTFSISPAKQLKTSQVDVSMRLAGRRTRSAPIKGRLCPNGRLANIPRELPEILAIRYGRAMTEV
ncbi:hypothetical protein EVAR_40372_1 [Eumeta japonica]|uniref:Uncharacterized protein n=1 Tax=Eumeta variegata TaxID=151549 RepID=A0A4C1XL98_EUMVA|nr:hypothetical protein EVAR_40372_1 [Eumeta japonica]